MNYFLKIGKTEQEIKERVDKDFEEIFFSENRIYEERDDLGYLVDTGNHDVRSEGQSYGMMIALQLDNQIVFDKIWRFTKKYMLIKEGKNKGYFGWSANTDGTLNSTGPAPDGEEFFAAALIFASKKWESEEFNYLKDARDILKAMIHNEDPMFNPSNKLIKFVPNMEISDPSYHLPHFYEIFAAHTSGEDSQFFKEAAINSRAYLEKACHPKTGLSAEYADYDGVPYNLNNHHLFYSDAYRTAANIALDALWCGSSSFHKTQANNILNFFTDENCNIDDAKINTIYHIDGTEASLESQVTEKDGKSVGVLHPLGLLATLAQASMFADEKFMEVFVTSLWDSSPRTGNRRYYDNLLYLFAMLALSGRYRKYI